MNNFKKLNDDFFKLESELDLFNKKIYGIYFWELIRFELNRKILIKKGLITEPHKKIGNKFKYIFNNIFNILKSVFIKNPFYGKKNTIYIIGHSKKQSINNINTDIYTDFIKSSLDNYQDFEPFCQNRSKINNKYSKNILFLDITQYIKELGLFFIKIKFNEKDIEIIEKIENGIIKYFGINIKITDIIINNIKGFLLYKRIYKTLFKIKKPKLIINVVGYLLLNKSIHYSAKTLNIPTIELQHGVIDKYHLGYSMGNKKNIKSNYFPDYIFTWGNYWNNVCNYPKNTKIIPTGFPYFELNKSRYNINMQHKNNIVVISQGAIGEELSKKIYNTAKELNNYTFYYKLHPGEFHKIDKEFSFLKELKNIKIITSEKTVYDLFEICSIQIGVFSTALYEGLGFGLKTIIFDLPGVEYLDDLVEKEIVKKVYTDKECIDIIQNNNFGKFIEFDNNDFFKLNALNNILQNIKKIQN